MAVTSDAIGADFFSASAVNTVTGSPFATNNITAAATGLAALVTWNDTNASSWPTGVTVTYSGASMPLVAGATLQVTVGTESGQSSIYQKASPPAGSASLVVTWTGGAMNVIVDAISVKGGDTTTPFINGTSNSAVSSASPTISVNSPVNDLAIGVCGSYTGVSIATVNQTQIFMENGGPFGNGFGNLTAGAGVSTTLSGTTSAAADWVYAACTAQVPSSFATTLTGKEQKILLPGTGPARGLRAMRAFPSVTGAPDTAGYTIFRVQRPTWR